MMASTAPNNPSRIRPSRESLINVDWSNSTSFCVPGTSVVRSFSLSQLHRLLPAPC